MEIGMPLIRIGMLGLVVACLASSAATQDDRAWDEIAYLGLGVRDTTDGLVVGWVYPGPLGGMSFTSESGIQRGDNVVSLNGEVLDADGFKEALDQMSVGDEVVLVMRRSPDANMNASVPKGGQGGDEFTVAVVLSSKAEWSGTIGRGLGERTIPEAQEGEFEQMILQRAREVAILDKEDGVAALIDRLGVVQDDALDPGSLPAVVQMFERPLSLDRVEHNIADQVARIDTIGTKRDEGDLKKVTGAIIEILALPDLSEVGTEAVIAQVASSANSQNEKLLWSKATLLVDQMRNDWSIYGENAEDHLRVIQSSVDEASIGVAVRLKAMEEHAFAWDAMVRSQLMMNRSPMDEDDLPENLREAVQGDVLAFDVDQSGHYRVLGGKGDNRYDMSKIASVVDIDGNDVYHYPDELDLDPNSPTRNQSIVDWNGNDQYLADGSFFGPATGVYGYSLIDDHAGDDVYSSDGRLSIGAGLFGVGVLIDRGGNDRYENMGEQAGFTMGVGYWGAGIILDKAGADTYIGEKLCQGVGGPRGFGVIVDSSGRDVYRANGPTFGSAYGTPGVFLGMSQGFGVGIRGYASGGVGAIYDFGGNDRYEAGEFSQAGGYYFGLGIMHDYNGHDLYYGNRYGQAFAAHQAGGILVDEAGDDTYWSMTAASQGGTWDESIGMLIDKAGNDSYRCDGLGQGAAAMQAIGILIDLGGDDRYSANPGSTMGTSGSNTYHYDADKVMSFSGFFDLGGGRDVYSVEGRGDGVVTPTGKLNEGERAQSTLYGVFVDE
jgi:hypothetical protein